METPKKLEEKDVNRFNLTKQECEYILENANFNKIQENVFKRLTSKYGRQSIVKISMEEEISTATVNRIIKEIKKRIYRLLLNE